ncbi:MAG: hypothetical protein MUO29_03330 [Desulfobacterales bacterium]|nr:hypothetical protein [Desulfobacterales bacterium]
MEEKEGLLQEAVPPEEKMREVDLNALFPGRGYDLNRLFPDGETKKLLRDVKRNKRDLERFVKNLQMEEE